MDKRIADPAYAIRIIDDCCDKRNVSSVRGLCCEGHRALAWWTDSKGGGGLAELDRRVALLPVESRSAQGLASADATLDEAFNRIQGIDRNTLPADVNQFIDLAAAALKVVSGDMANEGVPDPDNPNGSVYGTDDRANAMAWG